MTANPLTWLDGYKTLIAGVGMILLGAYELTMVFTAQTGPSVDGMPVTYEGAISKILAGIGALGLRRAITKSASGEEAVKKVAGLLLAAGLASALVACGPVKPGTADEQYVLAGGDVGTAACLGASIKLKPDQLAVARRDVAAARAVLDSPNATLALVEAALVGANLDPTWTKAAHAAIDRIRQHLAIAGYNTDLLPKDGLGFAIVRSFLDACEPLLASLEPAPVC
jgi:hypothetical protein